MILTMRAGVLSIITLFITTATATSAAPLLELKVGDTAYVGKSVAHNDDVCWLASREGRLREVYLEDVTSFRKLGGRFRGLKAVDLRNRLREEFGHDWEIIGAGPYLVCAPDGRAQRFARSFDDLYRSFRRYFSRRGFRLPQPEFPMVAVVYPTQQSFAANCQEDQVPFLPGLKGYYHRRTNRVCLFESPQDRLTIALPPPSDRLGLVSTVPQRQRAVAALGSFTDVTHQGSSWDGAIQADLKNTIVHEATHQVAYNLGLHTRIGDNPKWVTEGLATMFEAEGTRDKTSRQRPQQRLNEERFAWFSAYAQQGRRPKSLAKFLMSDRLFQTSPLDAYAQAWALMFYLAETRSSQLTTFLETISARDPMTPYKAEERLADFQEAFGNDINRLEVAFLRYMDDLR